MCTCVACLCSCVYEIHLCAQMTPNMVCLCCPCYHSGYIQFAVLSTHLYYPLSSLHSRYNPILMHYQESRGVKVSTVHSIPTHKQSKPVQRSTEGTMPPFLDDSHIPSHYYDNNVEPEVNTFFFIHALLQ